ncbi:hypothetical protein ABPG77_008917 [Micractinium sp. CCAP 211/92]
MSAAPQPPPEPLKQRIDALCAYAAKNGTAFLQSIVEKQSKTPEYSFLHGGPGSDYYQYKLQAATATAPSAQPAQGGPAPPVAVPAATPGATPAAAAGAVPTAPVPASGAPAQQAAQDPALATLPVEVSSGWQQVLGLLNGSRDSIRNSQQWFMACAPYAAGMAAMMLQQVLHLTDYQKQLHVIYLANDILFKGLSTRAAGAGPDQDGIAAAFKPRLGPMLRHAYVTGGQTAEYPGQPPAGYYPPPPGAPPGSYPAPPGAPGAYPPPPGPGQDVYYPPPPAPAPAPEPEPEPEGFDPMSFPPGLIPKLVEEKLKTDPPYSPLSILDIEQSGVPPPPKMDAYLKARVDKMYAQLADYRPGTLFSDIEVDAPRRGKHFSDREREPVGATPLPPPMPDLPHAGLGLGPAPGATMGFGPGGMPVDDGSFAGLGSGRGSSGLGWSSARADRRQPSDSAEAEAAAPAAAVADASAPVLGGMPAPGEGAPTFESVFSSYRNLRSKGYHKMILDNAAKKFGR